MFSNIGVPELLIIGVIVLVLFGGKKIPEMMSGLGKGMKEFKKSMKDDDTTEADSKKISDK